MFLTWGPFNWSDSRSILIFVTFLADSVSFKDKFISHNVQIHRAQNLVEMCFTKSCSSCKNLSFIWLLDCYQISILPPLLYAENCCTIADKIHSKTEVSLIQFSWYFYRILYDKCTACILNFKPFQIDLATQTQTWSQLAQFLILDRFQAIELYFFKLNQTWNQLDWILSQDIYPFNSLTKSHIMNLSNSSQSKLNHLAFNPFNHLIASNIA